MKHRLGADQNYQEAGECIPKEDTPPTVEHFLLVSHREQDRQTEIPEKERSGAAQDPFTDLRSALEKADELTAPYLDEEQRVTIHLSKGPHFITLSDSYYRAKKVTSKTEKNYHLVLK